MHEEFYANHNLKKSGGGPGGQFNGPRVKYISREDVVVDIEATLLTFEEAIYFTNYLRTIRELHNICMLPKIWKTSNLLLITSEKYFFICMTILVSL